jgi:cytosine/adenosine deaminase-related metal-dependent hydrolase
VARGRTVSLKAAKGEADVDALLLPGLVNAHAHLDLAGAAAIPDRGTFADWLMGVGRARGIGGDIGEAAATEARALATRGVVAIGDIDANRGLATRGRRNAAVEGVSYLEIVGVGAPSARARLAGALAAVDRLGVSVGLSPHAPYSVSSEVIPEIVSAARRRRLPLAMHLAESLDETRYLTHGDGPFVEFLKGIGRGFPFEAPPGLRPIPWADRQGLLKAGCVVIHGNDLDDDDVAILGQRSARVVYCHGTHQHFSRPPHRLLELLQAGVQVGLGTDSGVSNQGVDLLGELGRLAADRADISPLTILHCATVGGRAALSLDPGGARFEPGSQADGLLLGGLPGDAENFSPHDWASWALSAQPSAIATLHQGRAVFAGRDTPPFLDSFCSQG